MKSYSIPEILRVPLEELCLHIMVRNIFMYCSTHYLYSYFITSAPEVPFPTPGIVCSNTLLNLLCPEKKKNNPNLYNKTVYYCRNRTWEIH